MIARRKLPFTQFVYEPFDIRPWAGGLNEHLITPQRFYHTQQGKGGDKHVYAIRSRFVPTQILPKFDQTSWAPGEGVGAEAARGPRAHLEQ